MFIHIYTYVYTCIYTCISECKLIWQMHLQWFSSCTLAMFGFIFGTEVERHYRMFLLKNAARDFFFFFFEYEHVLKYKILWISVWSELIAKSAEEKEHGWWSLIRLLLWKKCLLPYFAGPQHQRQMLVFGNTEPSH